MRNLLVIALASLAFAPPLPAQDAKPDSAAVAAVKDTLVKLEKQSWEAWKNHDGKFFSEFLSDDHVEMGFRGPTNKATVVGAVSGAVCTVKSYEVDKFELAMLAPDTALLTYRAAQDTTCGGKAVPSPVWVSSLLMKRGGRWVNVLYQQSAGPQ